jgi:4-hydroxythreonine-4-phosphate dehydrogenase
MVIKPIILTMGDPAGIGPEIILNSFKNPLINEMPLVVFGDVNVLNFIKNKINISGFDINKLERIEEAQFQKNKLNVLDFNLIDMDKYELGKINAMCGHAAFEYVLSSIKHVKEAKARAVTTAPLNKEALHLAGHLFPGHTEIFAQNCNTDEYAMLLYDEKLSIIHVSTHVSLLDAINNLTQERIEKVIELADKSMHRILGRTPKIAVAGLNPHSGENGLFGNQEELYLVPAIDKMKEKTNVVGPVSPDTVFYKGINGEYDIVVAMFHDQGHIPFKMYAFESGVNTSVGLPIVRTSVDHGTAYDIAGKGIANVDSIINAIKLADKLTQ